MPRESLGLRYLEIGAALLLPDGRVTYGGHARLSDEVPARAFRVETWPRWGVPRGLRGAHAHDLRWCTARE